MLWKIQFSSSFSCSFSSAREIIFTSFKYLSTVINLLINYLSCVWGGAGIYLLCVSKWHTYIGTFWFFSIRHYLLILCFGKQEFNSIFPCSHLPLFLPPSILLLLNSQYAYIIILDRSDCHIYVLRLGLFIQTCTV